MTLGKEALKVEGYKQHVTDGEVTTLAPANGSSRGATPANHLEQLESKVNERCCILRHLMLSTIVCCFFCLVVPSLLTPTWSSQREISSPGLSNETHAWIVLNIANNDDITEIKEFKWVYFDRILDEYRGEGVAVTYNLLKYVCVQQHYSEHIVTIDLD